MRISDWSSDVCSSDLRAVESWQDCLEGADIQVEASRLEAPTPHFKTAWVKPGNFVVPYGTMSAVELSLTDAMDKLVVDDWGQCKGGKLGALRSEEHTSELQSLMRISYAVFCLKKKTNIESQDQ